MALRAYILFLLATTSVAAAQLTPLTFSGATAVGNTSAPVVVTLTAQTSGSITSFTTLAPDFSATPITCAVGMPLVVGESCTVSVLFSPLYPGVRQGAVVATSGITLLASAPLSGIGQGSLPVLTPGTINTVAGNGEWIYQRDGIPAIDAPIFLPSGLAVDAAGDLYLCDTNNNRIRRVDAASGNISTVAGNGSAGSGGDGGPATSAALSNPSGLAIDGGGNLFIADTGNNAVRRVDAVSGVITTFAGQTGTAGYSGDGGPARIALLASPGGLALMPGGDLLITDTGNNAVRMVSITTGLIQTVAGTGVAGYNGDGILATAAELNTPYGVAVRGDGAFAIADLQNQRVRLVNTSGVISTALGTGQRNAGSPTQEQLDGPAAAAFDPAGNLYVADAGNDRIREVLASDGSIQTVTGTSSEQFAGDGGPANQASLYGPYAVVFDAHGNLWISDTFHNRVREITGSLLELTYPAMKVGNVSPPTIESMANDGNASLILSTPVLAQAALDSGTTTCNQTAMPPASSCNMGVEFAPTAVGSNITGSVQWPSNAPNVTPEDSLSGVVLSVNVTSVKVTSSLNPAALGSTVTFTATVTSQNTSRTGTVTFTEGSTTWCPAVSLASNGTATCAVSGLSLGSHVINASYSGDTDDAPSSSAGYTEVIKQRPALVLSASPDPAVAGSTITMTLTAVGTSSVPTGTVVFYDGATNLGSSVLNASGMAQWTSSTLITGTHSLSAQYGGDSATLTGTSNTVSEPVNQAATTTTLLSSASIGIVGLPLVFTATVTNSNGLPTTGSVTFHDGATTLGTQNLVAGISALTISTLSPGSHTISAAYSGDSNNAASTSSSLAESISQIATNTTLSSNVSVLNAGGAALLTADAAMAVGAIADGALSGSITFKDGAKVLGVVAINASGLANLTLSNLTAGTHTLSASFSGNTKYAPSIAASLSLVVQVALPNLSLSGPSLPVDAGLNANFTAALATPGVSPTGTLSLLDNGTPIATDTVTGSGSFSFSTAALAIGTHAITASYSGDSNNSAVLSVALTLVIRQAASTVSLAASPNPLPQGAGLNLSAMVASDSPGLGGQVKFFDGPTLLGGTTLGSQGAAGLAVAQLSPGSHTLTAVYAGDINHAGATSAALTEVVLQPSSGALSSNNNPAASGQSVVFTAMVSGGGKVTPTGSVSLADNGNLMATVALDQNGDATFSTESLSVGQHSITMSYTGDANFSPASARLTQTVTDAATTTTLTGPESPATFGQAISLTAAVHSNGSPATGAVTFTDGPTTVGTATLGNTGSAVLALSTLAPGSHTIVAAYNGSSSAASSSSTPLPLTVKQNTQLALTSSGNPALTLSPISITATVTNAGASPLTGTVEFTLAGVTVGSAALDATGRAILNLPAENANVYDLTASYSGDGNNFSSAAVTYAQTVQLRPTTTTVTGSAGDPSNPQQITLIAVVGSQGPVPPSGAVTFSSGNTTLGQATVNTTGVAILTSTFTQSTEPITVTYAGDSNYAVSQSTANINAATVASAPQFVLAVSAPSVTVVTSAHTTIQVSIASVTGFSDTIALGCLGLPHAGTCTFNPSQVVLSANGTATASLVVDTGNPLGAGPSSSASLASGGSMFLCWLPLGLLAGALRKRGLAAATLFFLLLSGLVGCGGLSTADTTPGSYTIKIVGTGQTTGVSETQTLKLVVTQ